MSEIKYTPGPWRWEDWDQDDGPNKTTLTADPKYRPGGPCGMYPDLRYPILRCEDEAPNEANARLIAAAPDLLEVLKEINEMLACSEIIYREASQEKIMPLVVKIQEAIAKAESHHP